MTIQDLEQKNKWANASLESKEKELTQQAILQKSEDKIKQQLNEKLNEKDAQIKELQQHHLNEITALKLKLDSSEKECQKRQTSLVDLETKTHSY